MNTATFAVNVVRDRSLTTKRRTIHRVTCRWVGRARRSYRCDAGEAARLIARAHLDQRTKCCTYCTPDIAAFVLDAT